MAELDSSLRALRHDTEVLRESRANLTARAAKLASDLEHLEATCLNDLGVEAISLREDTAIVRIEGEGLHTEEEESRTLKQRLDNMGPVNMMALEEYTEIAQRHVFLETQRKDLIDSIENTQASIKEIDDVSRIKFDEAYKIINENFSVTFSKLFGGGQAFMRLTDAENANESGIEIVASPPGKKLQNILLLSGGEKALTALSLLVGIFQFQPAPFCVLDEVDAPLDETNVGRFAKLIAEMSATTQFIVITHSKRTMSEADVIYGVTMQEPGVSKIVSVNLGKGNRSGQGRRSVASPDTQNRTHSVVLPKLEQPPTGCSSFISRKSVRPRVRGKEPERPMHALHSGFPTSLARWVIEHEPPEKARHLDRSSEQPHRSLRSGELYLSWPLSLDKARISSRTAPSEHRVPYPRRTASLGWRGGGYRLPPTNDRVLTLLPCRRTPHPHHHLRRRYRLPCVPLRVLRAMDQQPTHAARQLLAPHPARLLVALGRDQPYPSLRLAQPRACLGHHHLRPRSRLQLRPQHVHLCARQLQPLGIRQQPVETPRNMPQMKRHRSQPIRPRIHLRIRQALAPPRHVLTHELQRVQHLPPHRIHIAQRSPQPRLRHLRLQQPRLRQSGFSSTSHRTSPPFCRHYTGLSQVSGTRSWKFILRQSGVQISLP